ncbi:sensor histidine kinase [Allonocardiopsis opalescens]|uniref:histidine kinase n=1 Tax=Allonocardiopsis opalescens TaxID=1144618 RepID=A0A2T0PS78_9ACTN|nr:sensor histidine kinase [Allonocardiopsis opalescens]PRX91734.1 signal transduction histidine kinase [Allonocardiopsis opalescens]
MTEPDDAGGDRAPLLLSVLLWGTLAVLCAEFVYRVFRIPEWAMLTQFERIAVGAGPAVAPILLALWPLLRWTPRAPAFRKVLSVVFLSVLTTIGMLMGSLTAALLMAIAMLHTVSVFGTVGGVCYATLLTLYAFGVTSTNPRYDLGSALFQSAFIALFAAWLVVMATVLTRAQEADRRNRRLLAELTDAHAELERSAARVRELTVAEERARMAREMHDSVGHYLTVIGLGLRNARRYRTARPDAAWAEVDQAEELTHQALTETRRWVRALKPLALEGQASGEAMLALAESFDATGMEVSFRTTGTDPGLSEEAELLLYRALQEGLTNAARHSGAAHVRAELAFSPAAARLTVTDDGGGADPDAVEAGFGLSGLRQRAESAGGAVATAHPEGGGFELRVTVPVAAPPDAPAERPAAAGTAAR